MTTTQGKGTPMRTWLWRSLAPLMALALLAAACGEIDDSGEAAPGVERLDIGLTLEPPTLDFTENSAAAIPEVVLYNVMETLVEIDSDGEVLPLLAEDWDVSDDGLVYTFHLTDAEFHDGTELSADDVVYSFERAMDPDTGHPFAGDFGPVDTVEAIDDRSVEVTLAGVSNNWLFNMGRSPGIVYSEAHVDDLAEAPVGTGPYEVSDWVRGDRIELARNEDYRGEAPAVDEIAFRYIEDPSALNNALLAGDIDLISRVTAPELLEEFEEDGDYEVLEGLSDGHTIVTMNNAAEPLDDVRVRQAISYAIDAEGVRDTTYAGYGELIGAHASPHDPWYVDLSDRYAHDPDRARELLAEAGHADGLSLEMQLPPPPYARRGGEVIAGQLAEVGIDVELENVEWGPWLDDVLGASDFELTIISHVEPRDIVQYGNPDYYWNYDNPEVAEWIAEADSTTDPEERDALYGQVQEQISEDAVNVFLYLLPELAVVRDGVEGYEADKIAGAIDVRDLTASP